MNSCDENGHMNQSPYGLQNYSSPENISSKSSIANASTPKDGHQQSPASSSGLDTYPFNMNTALESMRCQQRKDVPATSPNVSSTISSKQNDGLFNSSEGALINSRQDYMPQSPSSKAIRNSSNIGNDLHPRYSHGNVDASPHLPPYSSGYLHNIFASFGYRSSLQEAQHTSDLDRETTANIANIAKSIVHSGLTSPGSSPISESRKVRDKPFQCTLCHKRYTNRAGLTVHLLSHTGERPHACMMCDRRFTQKSALDQHLMIHTGERPYECKICFKTFTQKANLNAHMLIHSGDKPYQCQICQKRFTQRSNLNTHILTHSDLGKMQAVAAMGAAGMYSPSSSASGSAEMPVTTDLSVPSLPFPVGPTHTPQSLQKYNPNLFSGENPSGSQFNNDTEMDKRRQSLEFLKSQLNMRSPMANDTGEADRLERAAREHRELDHIKPTLTGSQTLPPMDQDPNQRVFKTDETRSIADENQVAPNMNPFQNETFQNILANIRNSFVAKVRSHDKPSDNKERPFQCMFCEKRFTQRAGLNAHVLIHSGQRPHPCSICDKRFTQKSGLDQHMLTHTGERPHQCHLCNKRFTQKANLNHHILTHTGEKRHICPFCDRRFTQKANLNAHILTHTGEKPHQCAVCERRFTQKSGLNQHILTHTGEKPYRCKLCDKSYTQKSGLDVHMYSHSGQKPYRCQFCDKQFVARTLWAKHLRSSHGHEEPPPTNAYGRGGHGGMNLIRSLSLPGISIGGGSGLLTKSPRSGASGMGPLPSLSFDMGKSGAAAELFKQLHPSDCYRLLNESYAQLEGSSARPVSDSHSPFNRHEQAMNVENDFSGAGHPESAVRVHPEPTPQHSGAQPHGTANSGREDRKSDADFTNSSENTEVTLTSSPVALSADLATARSVAGSYKMEFEVYRSVRNTASGDFDHTQLSGLPVEKGNTSHGQFPFRGPSEKSGCPVQRSPASVHYRELERYKHSQMSEKYRHDSGYRSMSSFDGGLSENGATAGAPRGRTGGSEYDHNGASIFTEPPVSATPPRSEATCGENDDAFVAAKKMQQRSTYHVIGKGDGRYENVTRPGSRSLQSNEGSDVELPRINQTSVSREAEPGLSPSIGQSLASDSLTSPVFTGGVNGMTPPRPSGNMYQERYASMYREMMSSGYAGQAQDSSAFT